MTEIRPAHLVENDEVSLAERASIFRLYIMTCVEAPIVLDLMYVMLLHMFAGHLVVHIPAEI